MLVQIKSTSEDSDVEWALIELNGELIIPTESIDDKNELELGAIRFTSDGTPIITLGTHEIKGKIEKLKNQRVVLTKKNASYSNNAQESNMQYEISGIVKKKLLFNQYPKTIMRS